MRVEREGVGAPEPGVAGCEGRVRDADGAVGPIDVEPEPLRLAEGGHLVEGIDRARVDGPGARRHAERTPPGGAVPGDGGAERLHVHPEVAVHGNRPHRVPAETQDLRRFSHAAVALFREVEDERCGGAPQTARADVPAVRGRGPVTRGGEAREGGRGASAYQEPHAALDREAHELHQPPDGGTLDVDGCVVPARAARIEGRREEVRHDADGRRRRVHPAEEARMPVPHRVLEDLAPDNGEQASRGSPRSGQGALEERRALRRGHRREDRPIADPLEMVGDQVHGRVSEPPERLRRHGGRRGGRCRGRSRRGHGRLLTPAGSPRPRRACGLLSTSAMAR